MFKNIKIKYGMIVNETTIRRGPNDTEINTYNRSPNGLQL